MFDQDCLAVAPMVLYALKIPAGPYGEAINSLNTALGNSYTFGSTLYPVRKCEPHSTDEEIEALRSRVTSPKLWNC